MNPSILIGLGLVAQGLFSARFLIQLIRSEKAGKVINPLIFWQLSLIASILLMVYGAFRHDLAIVIGQVICYLVYIRNLQLFNLWKLFPKVLRVFFWVLPIVIFGYLLLFWRKDMDILLDNPEIDLFLLTWGSLGQIVFSGRFLIQWYASEKRQESYFPKSFWYISIVGALLIVTYAIVRKDAVLFIGQAFGLIVYSRNLWLGFQKMEVKKEYLLDKLEAYRMYLLIGILGLALFFNLGAWSVTESSEARYAQISKEMLETGDWIHPSLMGIHHYHKPPFTYWITAISYQIFGVNPFAARFFLQIAILIQVALVYKIALLLLNDRRKAFLSALLYASMPLVIIGSRALTTDAYLTAWVLGGIYWSFKFKKSQQTKDALLAFACYGLGFLTKGPVVWIVPVLLEIVDGIKSRRLPRVGWVQGFGLVLMFALGLSWFLYLMIEDARFFDYFVLRHTVERFASDTFSRSQPFWYYWVILTALSFPWFILLLINTKSALKDLSSKSAYFWVWVIIPLIFFSISKSKLVLYILPIMAGLAIGSVLIWEKLSDSSKRNWEKAQLIFHLIVLLGFLIAPQVESRLMLNYKFWFIWVITFSTLLALWRTGIRQSDRPIISAFIFTVGLTLMSTYFFSQNPGLGNDTRNLVSWIEEHRQPEEQIVVFDKRLPSIPFQTAIPVLSIYDGDESLNREIQFESDDTWKEGLVNLKEDPGWILNPENQNGIWVAKAKRKMPELGLGREWQILTELDGWKLMRIRIVK